MEDIIKQLNDAKTVSFIDIFDLIMMSLLVLPFAFIFANFNINVELKTAIYMGLFIQIFKLNLWRQKFLKSNTIDSKHIKPSPLGVLSLFSIFAGLTAFALGASHIFHYAQIQIPQNAQYESSLSSDANSISSTLNFQNSFDLTDDTRIDALESYHHSSQLEIDSIKTRKEDYQYFAILLCSIAFGLFVFADILNRVRFHLTQRRLMYRNM